MSAPLTPTAEWLMIAGMLAVTFGTRYLPLLLGRRNELPQSVQRGLRFVPVAVLTALVTPMILLPGGEWAISARNPYLVASIVAVVIAAWRRHLMLTIAVGMLVFIAWRFAFAA